MAQVVVKSPTPLAGAAGTVVVLLLATAGTVWPGWTQALSGDRAALAHGGVHRLWTAHLAHFSGSHLLWSGLVWLLGAGWMERVDRRAWWALALILAPVITVAGLLMEPGMATYGGLSGVATAPLVWLGLRAVCHGADMPRWAGAVVLVGVVAKISADGMGEAGALLARFGPESGTMRVAVWAHVAGAMAGVGLFGASAARSRLKAR